MFLCSLDKDQNFGRNVDDFSIKSIQHRMATYTFQKKKKRNQRIIVV